MTNMYALVPYTTELTLLQGMNLSSRAGSAAPTYTKVPAIGVTERRCEVARSAIRIRSTQWVTI